MKLISYLYDIIRNTKTQSIMKAIEKANQIVEKLNANGIKAEVQADQLEVLFGFTYGKGVWYWFEVYSTGYVSFKQRYSQNNGKTCKSFKCGFEVEGKIEPIIGEELWKAETSDLEDRKNAMDASVQHFAEVVEAAKVAKTEGIVQHLNARIEKIYGEEKYVACLDNRNATFIGQGESVQECIDLINKFNAKAVDDPEFFELFNLCKQIESFEFEGVAFIGNRLDAVSRYIKSNPSKKFFIWLQDNFERLN